MNIPKILTEIGLSEKEGALYTALLRLGTAKAAAIADAADLQRTTAYDILKTLSRKGLITKYTKGSSAFYSATDPRSLLSYLQNEQQQLSADIERKKSRVTELLPEFISIAKEHSTSPKVRFYEGEKGMREALEDTLESRETILAYADIGSIYEGAKDFFPDYLARRVKKKIHARAIAPDTEVWRETEKRGQQEMRTVKFLPAGENYTPEINIYNNKMLIISWKEKMAVIIESKELATLQKVIYNQLWDRLL